MKQANLEKKIHRCIFVAILSLFCAGNLNAKNEDTPNLDFSFGSFANWERYYAVISTVQTYTRIHHTHHR